MEHRDQEQTLRKEKWKQETGVEGILGRYDEEMTKKQVICLLLSNQSLSKFRIFLFIVFSFINFNE
jgi:hypothetical protein